MTVQNFSPEVWSPLLVKILQEKQDITSIFNRDYEGDIKEKGDTVNINKYGGGTVRDYNTTGADIVVDNVTSSTQQLLINKNKYQAINIEDVDAIQANISLENPVLLDIAEKFQVQMNQDVLSDCLTGVPTINVVAAGAAIDLADFKEARRLLSRQNVPLADRWAILHPHVESDLLGIANIIKANEYGSDVPLKTGEIGSILGFRIIISTSVKQTGTTAVYNNVFMHGSACAFAMQKEMNIEATRRELRFADLFKAFILYGTKLVQPNAIVNVTRTV